MRRAVGGAAGLLALLATPAASQQPSAGRAAIAVSARVVSADVARQSQRLARQAAAEAARAARRGAPARREGVVWVRVEELPGERRRVTVEYLAN